MHDRARDPVLTCTKIRARILKIYESLTNTHNTLDWHHAHTRATNSHLTHFYWHHAHLGGLPTNITHFDWHHAHLGGLPIHKTQLDLLTNIFFMTHLGIMAPHLGYHRNSLSQVSQLTYNKNVNIVLTV